MPRRAHGHRLHNRAGMRGAVLAVALIFLIVMALLGISVMNVSLQEQKMASQFMQKSRVQTQAEDCLKTAEANAKDQVDAQLNRPGGMLPHVSGFLDVANGTVPAAVGDPAWWEEPSHTLPCNDNGRYVIEYLGVQDIVLPEDRYTGRTHPMHAFRITARGTAGTEASVVLQTIFLRNSS
jgi:Tfp pilus assembly protein PilX